MIDTLTQKYNLTTKHIIRENTKKEGVEIYFSSIPSGIERETLKENNWKWSAFNKCWYIKKMELGIETQKLVEKKAKIEETKKIREVATKKVSKTSEKQVLSVVNKILKYNEKQRPILSAFTPLENNKVAFTDSYRLCVLNRDNLPNKVAFNENNKDMEKEYIKKYKNEVVKGNYPNIKKILSDYETNETDETFTFNVEEIKKNANENKGINNKSKRMLDFKSNKGGNITIDSEYLYDMVKLLQIKDENVTMNYYAEVKPTTYENENGFYLVLPIRKF